MTHTTNAVADFLAEYSSAVLAASVSRFSALYAQDVEIFDTWEVWRYRGRQAWQQMVHQWFESLGDERVEVTFTDVRTHLGTDMAAGSGYATYAAVSPTGERLRALTNRFSVVLKRQGSSWLVVHEHTSLPVGFESKVAVPATASGRAA